MSVNSFGDALFGDRFVGGSSGQLGLAGVWVVPAGIRWERVGARTYLVTVQREDELVQCVSAGWVGVAGSLSGAENARRWKLAVGCGSEFC